MIELVIPQRRCDLGGFEVGRVLPHHGGKMVGPFIFFDHMGPVEFAPGIPRSVDVRPHPHIGLATVTYLFEGEILHRDSLGTVQPIRPGDVNWMTAGRGIAHSERTPPELRTRGSGIFGIQLWVGLPRADEEAEPAFVHADAAQLPMAGEGVRVILGEWRGASAQGLNAFARPDVVERDLERRRCGVPDDQSGKDVSDTNADRVWAQGDVACGGGLTCSSGQYCVKHVGGVPDAAPNWLCFDIPAACTTGVTCDCVKPTTPSCATFQCMALGSRQLACGEGVPNG